MNERESKARTNKPVGAKQSTALPKSKKVERPDRETNSSKKQLSTSGKRAKKPKKGRGNSSRFRKWLPSIAAAGFVVMIILIIYSVQRNNQNDEFADRVVNHEELSFSLPENWNIIEREEDTAIRIRGEGGEILGAVLIQTFYGDMNLSLERNLENISAITQVEASNIVMNEVTVSGSAARRYRYTGSSGGMDATFDSFLIPSGNKLHYIQLRVPIDDLDQAVLQEFENIVLNLSYLPSEFFTEN